MSPHIVVLYEALSCHLNVPDRHGPAPHPDRRAWVNILTSWVKHVFQVFLTFKTILTLFILTFKISSSPSKIVHKKFYSGNAQ